MFINFKEFGKTGGVCDVQTSLPVFPRSQVRGKIIFNTT